ncbi:hypothetical protein OROGR_018935 [Orobanche gracilis]
MVVTALSRSENTTTFVASVVSGLSFRRIFFISGSVKSESRELQQTTKCDIYEGQADESEDLKHERDAYSEHKGYEKMDKDGYSGSNSQLNWKDIREQHRAKQYPDVPAVIADTWHMSHTGLHGLTDAEKGSLHVDNRGITEVREVVGENKVDMKEDDKFKDKNRKRKEVKHWDWGERDKERSGWRYNFPPGNDSSENILVKEEREYERWGSEKKEPLKEKEKLSEKEKNHVKMELWSSTDKEVSHNEKELVDIPGKSIEQETSALELKKKDHDTWKRVDRETRDRKKEMDADVGPERPDKRSRYHEQELDEGGMLAQGGMEWEREVFNCGVQQRKRMLRPRSIPQTGNSPHHRSGTNDNERSDGKLKVLRYAEGKGDVSCVAYKIGECMKELVKLWKEYELLQADKACEGSQTGPTLEIRISAEHVTATNRQVRGGQLWGTDVYTVDSDLVAIVAQLLLLLLKIYELLSECCLHKIVIFLHCGLRNNVRSRAWGAAIGCSYRVERCCIVKKGGGIIDLEPCLSHSSTMEPTLAPVAVERTMTTRAAASVLAL